MLGLQIKQYMQNVGIKFSVIAEKANIPLTTFSAMINGNRRITAEEYFAICKALDVITVIYNCCLRKIFFNQSVV